MPFPYLFAFLWTDFRLVWISQSLNRHSITEILLTDSILSNGSRLMDLGMPEKTLVIMVRRGDTFFVPTGSTQLMAGDKLLVITDNNEALEETYRKMGIVE